MRKVLFRLVPMLCCGALLAAGCAQQQMVRRDEPVAALAQTRTETKPAEPAKPEAPVKEEVVAAQPIQEVPLVEDPAAAKTSAAAFSESSRLLQGVIFDFDSCTLSAAAREILGRNADLLKKNSAAVQVEGHCDERGSDEYNLALGEKRARAALDYLVTLGVHRERLSFISYGKERPADPGHDESAWAKNRRADFAIVK